MVSQEPNWFGTGGLVSFGGGGMGTDPEGPPIGTERPEGKRL